MAGGCAPRGRRISQGHLHGDQRGGGGRSVRGGFRSLPWKPRNRQRQIVCLSECLDGSFSGGNLKL